MIGDVEEAAMEAPRRFVLSLLVVHPKLSPADITDGLGLEPHVVHAVGSPRSTPAGSVLPGTYAETRWRHSERHCVDDQYFARPLIALIEALATKGAFFAELRSSGGMASVIVQFLGDGYLGDVVPAEAVARIAELGLELGIECFSVPQSQ